MSIDLAQLDRWLVAATETTQLEFKEAKTQFDFTKLCRYCVALSNEGGGYLVLGVSNKAPRRVVDSQACSDIQKSMTDLYNKLHFRVEMHELQHPDGRVVVVDIPARAPASPRHLDGAYFMRNGEELVPMSEDHLRKIFNEQKQLWLDESAASALSGQDVIQLLDTQTYFDLLKQPYPTSQEAVLQRLQEESLISSKADGYDISNVAAVLLAKDLDTFRSVRRKAPRVIVYTGDNKLETRSDITGGKGYAVGFSGLVRYVCDNLPHNQVISDALRHDTHLLPDIVIRELLANALIHQDFSLTGMGPVVEIYQTRVEISNPGTPLIPPERFIDSNKSRNERLADVMRRFGICEEKSSGWDRVVTAAETHQLPAPQILLGYERTEVVIHGPRNFADMDRSDRTRACYQHSVLQWVIRQNMTNQSLRKRFGLSPKQSAAVSQIIAAAAATPEPLIKRDPQGPDSRKHARYLPIWA